MKRLSLDYLKSRLTYDPQSGVFIWKSKIPHSGIEIGQVAGTLTSNGYLKIFINRKYYLSHRLAWFYINGYWPKDQIDHINHNRKDNSIKNIRLSNSKLNQMNKSMAKNNTSGVTGVSWSKVGLRWVANIKVNYKSINLGSFALFHEAVNARKNAEALYGFHENHGKRL